MRKPEKVIRDGKVAVLLSPGFGAGWSTWEHEDGASELMIFDRRLVELAERGGTENEAEELAKELTGLDYIYSGGWSDISIKWVDEGTIFYVHEYDGSESLRHLNDGNEWRTA